MRLDIFGFFNDIMQRLNHNDNHVVIMAVFLMVTIITIMLRIITHLHFRGTIVAFHLDTKKEISTRADIGKLKTPILRKVAAEYIRLADKAVTTVPTKQLVDRAVNNISLVGWRYDGVLRFVEAMESGLLFIGLILAVVFPDFAFVYGTLAVLSFLLTRIIGAFFNARSAMAQLSEELQIYLEREIGRFFASDSGGAILRLKNDLTAAINLQAKTYKETMDAIAVSMTAAMSGVAKSMTDATASLGPKVAEAIDEKVINMNTSLTERLAEWEKALSEAGLIQTAMNEAAGKLSQAGNNIQTASNHMSTQLISHSAEQSDQLQSLAAAVSTVKEGLARFTEQQDALLAQSKYIEQNQKVLETTLSSYELALQELTKNVGEGLGTFISLHAQNSATAVDDALKANLDKIINLLSQNTINTPMTRSHDADGFDNDDTSNQPLSQPQGDDAVA